MAVAVHISEPARRIIERIADAVTTLQRVTITADEQGEAVAKDCIPLFEQLGMSNEGDGWGFVDGNFECPVCPLEDPADCMAVGHCVHRDGPPPEWRCFHCNEVFRDRQEAALHFGADEGKAPACQIKGAEGGLLKALRAAEAEADDAIQRMHAESTDAAQAYHRQRCRHAQALTAAEEVGYARGVRDGVIQVEAALKAFDTSDFEQLVVDEHGWTEFGIGWSRDRIVDWFGPTAFRDAIRALQWEGKQRE